jgi:hypothetical protein
MTDVRKKLRAMHGSKLQKVLLPSHQRIPQDIMVDEMYIILAPFMLMKIL